MDGPQSKAPTDKRDHPYRHQPDHAFWRRTVQDVYPLDIGHWYKKKFSLAGRKLATGGSCFAQHIGRELKRQGSAYLDVEPAPGFLPPSLHLDYGYGIYSARYGNIYTSRQLLQLLQRAFGEFEPAERPWERDGSFVDPFRPHLEPHGVDSPDEVDALRRYHLGQVVSLFEQTDVFVFTLGMTETWMSTVDGAVFPVAPGTAGGVYDETQCKFLNLTYPEIVEDLEAVIARLRSINNRMAFIFTVSPVSIMATGSRNQVVVANTYSKSILRGAAGYLTDKYEFVDYFPGYEITTSPPMRSMFYNPDMRTVSSQGVKHVMAHFFDQHAAPAPTRVKVGAGPPPRPKAGEAASEKVLCDEELAAAFGKFA